VLATPSKVFCIGSGKTGTTSLGAALQSLGFHLGDQSCAELLLEAWAEREFDPIIEYCRTAEAFQDVPFCLDHTYKALDEAYPGSKFILTVRNSTQEWHDSLVRFHTKIIGKRRLPTPHDMKVFPYRYPGWIWRAHRLIYGIDEATLFDPTIYKASYEAHIAGVLEYFARRPDDLLVLNVGELSAMPRLTAFLGVSHRGMKMPHLNSSRAA
jgi:hypothetical protein